jgi:hypothetical protein
VCPRAVVTPRSTAAASGATAVTTSRRGSGIGSAGSDR